MAEIIWSDKIFTSIYEQIRPYTMASVERAYALYQSVNYVIANDIIGDFVECGVWRGGSAMIIALTLLQLKSTSRKIYLYDTFEGMIDPGEQDVDLAGTHASELLSNSSRVENENNIWCYSTMEEVKKNLLLTDYPFENFLLAKGKVEDTIPGVIPKNICLLRIDTDWYQSTYHELLHLYPLLSLNGVLIVDDYGHWQGARCAVDQYFAEIKSYPLLQRIDYTGRLAVKTAN